MLIKTISHFVYAPRVGISFDYGAESSFGIFANVGMEYRYRRFFLDFDHKQGITPPFSTFNYKILEYYGQINWVIFFDDVCYFLWNEYR